MDQKKSIGILRRAGAIIGNGHFVYKSGKHGSAYVNKDVLYLHPEDTTLVCLVLANLFSRDSVEVVVGPMIGGIILSQHTALRLRKITHHQILSVYAEKTDDCEGFVIKRGYDKVVSGKRVLVVEDVLTTGASARKTVEAVRAVGGEVIGVGAICNRGGVTAEDVGNVPRLEVLMNIDFESWDESECPLCKQGVPINTDVGHGAEFLARLKA